LLAGWPCATDIYARIVGKETDDEQVRDKHNFASSMWKSERALDHDEVEASVSHSSMLIVSIHKGNWNRTTQEWRGINSANCTTINLPQARSLKHGTYGLKIRYTVPDIHALLVL
jgi:hypothetical protein